MATLFQFKPLLLPKILQSESYLSCFCWRNKFWIHAEALSPYCLSPVCVCVLSVCLPVCVFLLLRPLQSALPGVPTRSCTWSWSIFQSLGTTTALPSGPRWAPKLVLWGFAEELPKAQPRISDHLVFGSLRICIFPQIPRWFCVAEPGAGLCEPMTRFLILQTYRGSLVWCPRSRVWDGVWVLARRWSLLPQGGWNSFLKEGLSGEKGEGGVGWAGPHLTRGPAPLLQPETQGEGHRLPPGLCTFSQRRAGQKANLGRTHLGWARCLAEPLGGSEGVQGTWFRLGWVGAWGLEGRWEAELLLITRTWVGYDAQAALWAEDSSPALKTDVLLNSSR